jgi:hypothetical protein
MTSILRRLAALFVIACATAVVGHAQWLGYPAQGAPRLPNGKVNLSAKAPRARDGKPDLSGVWRTQLESTDGKPDAFVVPGDDPRTFNKYFLNILADFTADDAPMRPASVERMQRNRERRVPGLAARCLPLGLPLMDVFSYSPFKMIQTPGVLVVLYEMDNAHRQIYILSPRGEDIRSAGGKATRWWSTPRDSTIAPCSTRRAIRTANRCICRSASTGAISGTWI